MILNVTDSIQMYQDSLYLLQSNKLKCSELLNKGSLLEENDLIDIYISLHIILEVGFNALYRQIIIMSPLIVEPVNRLEVIEHIDGVGFIDKTILFIYNIYAKVDPKDFVKHQKIISRLRSFTCVRNQLLHGHSVGSLINDQSTKLSKAKLNINNDRLKKHLKLFVAINNDMQFFLAHLDVDGWSPGYLEDLRKEYLDVSFIPNLFS